MIKRFALYNFQFFWRKRKESEESAWFSTAGILSMGFAFNIATILFVTLGYLYPKFLFRFDYPAYVLIGIPWGILFFIFFLNAPLKKAVIKERFKPVDKRWQLIYWIYFIVTVIIYAFSMSYYSNSVY